MSAVYSTHDHVGHMRYSDGGCWCTGCGQRWLLVGDGPARRLFPVPYEGDHHAAAAERRYTPAAPANVQRVRRAGAA